MGADAGGQIDPVDGSTITVYVDGASVGRASYNHYRSDIATLFPGLANSNGAVGLRTIDTTTLAQRPAHDRLDGD